MTLLKTVYLNKPCSQSALSINLALASNVFRRTVQIESLRDLDDPPSVRDQVGQPTFNFRYEAIPNVFGGVKKSVRNLQRCATK